MAQLEDLSTELQTIIVHKALEDINLLERCRTCFQLALVSRTLPDIVPSLAYPDQKPLRLENDEFRVDITICIDKFNTLHHEYLSGLWFFRQHWDSFIAYFMDKALTYDRNRDHGTFVLRYIEYRLGRPRLSEAGGLKEVNINECEKLHDVLYWFD